MGRKLVYLLSTLVTLNDFERCKCVMTADARYLCGSRASGVTSGGADRLG